MATKTNPAVIEAFRRWGYLQADIDPLGRLKKHIHRDLQDISGPDVEKLREIYCGSIGADFMHIFSSQETDWIAERLEGKKSTVDQRFILNRLAEAEMFERFIHTRYVGSKRFSLEGLAAAVPLMDSILDRAAQLGFELVILGMPHRGRLTMMWTVCRTQARNIFACFEDVDPHSVFGAGDVKYHKGTTGNYRTKSGKDIIVRLASNPSHLEAVNPVAMGRTKARQDRIGDTEGKKVLYVLFHGDAAFAGQGITAETLNLTSIPGFSIGGTVHIVMNNLIGFTAPYTSCHSSFFSTDVVKRLPIPIYHVNAETPEDVYRVGEMAMDYRATFSNDVVIDLLGYRRYGHNEGDDPTFTSPTLYEQISHLPFLYQSYGKKLGLSENEIKQLEDKVVEELQVEREQAQTMDKQPSFFTLPDYWKPYVGGEYSHEYEVDTTVTAEQLKNLGKVLGTAPQGFNVHKKLAKLLQQREEMGAGTRPVDWSTAELFAFGSLLASGHPVRLSGQDCRRATFSQRHAVLVDSQTGEDYCPLQHISADQATFQVYDSVLSEAALVGFEYGYSREFPEALVCWEAQFGDFANGAQIIIDQFISAGEDKWNLLSGLVLLLPHGYEGQGPEHSSARLERFLQLAGEDNIQVAYPTTAAQYFHLLRRQVMRKWRKPLIVMTPKSMLRLPASMSPAEQFTQGSFQTIIADEERFLNAERILFCTGKIVHQLRAEREARGDTETSIVAIEQLYPFPEDELGSLIESYSNVKNIIWIQEEPANMGALFFVRPYLEQLGDRGKVSTIRRSASASPATGSAKAHELEQRALLNLAFARSK